MFIYQYDTYIQQSSLFRKSKKKQHIYDYKYILTFKNKIQIKIENNKVTSNSYSSSKNKKNVITLTWMKRFFWNHILNKIKKKKKM